MCLNYTKEAVTTSHRDFMNNDIFNAFESPQEQGGGEWRIFNSVTHDKTSFLRTTKYKLQRRTPSAIFFGASRLFILKRA